MCTVRFTSLTMNLLHVIISIILLKTLVVVQT